MKPHQNIRKPLFQVWEVLKQLGVQLSNEELDHSVVEILLAEAMDKLDDAHEEWMRIRPFPKGYVLGAEQKDGNFHILDGPTSNLQRLLEFKPEESTTIFAGLCIIEFSEIQDDSQDKVIYRWNEQWEQCV